MSKSNPRKEENDTYNNPGQKYCRKGLHLLIPKCYRTGTTYHLQLKISQKGFKRKGQTFRKDEKQEYSPMLTPLVELKKMLFMVKVPMVFRNE